METGVDVVIEMEKGLTTDCPVTLYISLRYQKTRSQAIKLLMAPCGGTPMWQ